MTPDTVNLFVYGTLRDDYLLENLLGYLPARTPALLHGYRKVGLNIINDDGESVEGDLMEISNIEDIPKLNGYEGGAYKLIDVFVETPGDEKVSAVAYQVIQ